MNRHEIVAYLRIVRDAENAICACRELDAYLQTVQNSEAVGAPEESRQEEAVQMAARALLEAIDRAAAENRALEARLGADLQGLYAQNVIRSPFRNLMAINQLLECLERGTCDSLEGSDGAYARYLWGIHAGRICASMDALKENMQRGDDCANAGEACLWREMCAIGANLSAVKALIEGCAAGLQRQVRGMRCATEAQLQARLAAVQGLLEEMQRELSRSAHAQYVARRAESVRRYLKGMEGRE